MRRLGQNGQIDPYIGLFGTDRTLIYAFCGLQSNCSLRGDDHAGRAAGPAPRGARALALRLQVPEERRPGRVARADRQGRRHERRLPAQDATSSPSSTIRCGTRCRCARRPSSGTDKREAAVIDALTLPNTFPAHYESLPDGDAILVLDVAAQPTSGSSAAGELRLAAPVIALILARVRRGSLIQLAAIGRDRGRDRHGRRAARSVAARLRPARKRRGSTSSSGSRPRSASASSRSSPPSSPTRSGSSGSSRTTTPTARRRTGTRSSRSSGRRCRRCSSPRSRSSARSCWPRTATPARIR